MVIQVPSTYFYLSPAYCRTPTTQSSDIQEISLDIKDSVSETTEMKSESFVAGKCALCDNLLEFPSTRFLNLINQVGCTVSSALSALKIRPQPCGHLACENCHTPEPKEKECVPCQKETREELQIKIDSTSLNSKQVIYNRRRFQKRYRHPGRGIQECLSMCAVTILVCVILGIASYSMNQGR